MSPAQAANTGSVNVEGSEGIPARSQKFFWWDARQRAQQNPLKSPRLYSDDSVTASHTLGLTPMSRPPVPGVVLDTNVVLDWLVYRDPSCVELDRAIRSGAVRWIASPEMRDEWDGVLARGVGAARAPNIDGLADTWARQATLLPAPNGPRNAPVCRCTDPDDQVFIDLALAQRARWLLSRDRAVLKLAAHARRRGLLIVAPTAWVFEAPA